MIFSRSEISVLSANKDVTEIEYLVKNLPGIFAYGLGATFRQVAYQMVPGIAPIGYNLLGISKDTDISNQFLETARDISSNIRRIKVKTFKPGKIFIATYNGMVQNTLKAGDLTFTDFSGNDTQIGEIINKDNHILSVSKPQDVNIRIVFAASTGVLRNKDIYKSLAGTPETTQLENILKGETFIRITANFSPIISFNTKVIESPEVPGMNDMKIKIKTDGSVQAPIVMSSITTILKSYLRLFDDISKIKIQPESMSEPDIKSDENEVLMNKPIEELTLDVDTYNKLKEYYNVNSIRELMIKVPQLNHEFREVIIKTLKEAGLNPVE